MTLEEIKNILGTIPQIRKVGIYLNYDPKGSHKGVIYFAIDLNKIYYDGKCYGTGNLEDFYTKEEIDNKLSNKEPLIINITNTTIEEGEYVGTFETTTTYEEVKNAVEQFRDIYILFDNCEKVNVCIEHDDEGIGYRLITNDNKEYWFYEGIKAVVNKNNYFFLKVISNNNNYIVDNYSQSYFDKTNKIKIDGAFVTINNYKTTNIESQTITTFDAIYDNKLFSFKSINDATPELTVSDLNNYIIIDVEYDENHTGHPILNLASKQEIIESNITTKDVYIRYNSSGYNYVSKLNVCSASNGYNSNVFIYYYDNVTTCTVIFGINPNTIQLEYMCYIENKYTLAFRPIRNNSNELCIYNGYNNNTIKIFNNKYLLEQIFPLTIKKYNDSYFGPTEVFDCKAEYFYDSDNKLYIKLICDDGYDYEFSLEETTSDKIPVTRTKREEVTNSTYTLPSADTSGKYTTEQVTEINEAITKNKVIASKSGDTLNIYHKTTIEGNNIVLSKLNDDSVETITIDKTTGQSTLGIIKLNKESDVYVLDINYFTNDGTNTHITEEGYNNLYNAYINNKIIFIKESEELIAPCISFYTVDANGNYCIVLTFTSYNCSSQSHILRSSVIYGNDNNYLVDYKNTILSLATQTREGLMSSEDKTKLDSLPTKTELDNTLSTKIDKEENKGLSTNDYTDVDRSIVESVKPFLPTVGDAILVNVSTLEKVAVSIDKLSNYPIEEWEPIGVVVIPTSHNVYSTNECGIMSLKYASATTPDIGTISAEFLYWGGYGTTYEELPTYTVVPSMGSMRDPVQLLLVGTNETGSIPVMYSEYTRYCPHDSKAFYASTLLAGVYVPSPYLKDDSRNPMYYLTEAPSSSLNALSDFSGKEHTEFLCALSTGLPNWKTDSSINNTSNKGYHPSACCCWRYYTVGTNLGDWYFPTLGELGYISARYDLINETISTLQTYFGKTFAVLSGSHRLNSSSYYNFMYAYTLNPLSGLIEKLLGPIQPIRPFLRLNLTKGLPFYTRLEIDNLLATVGKETFNIYE